MEAIKILIEQGACKQNKNAAKKMEAQAALEA